MSFTSWTPFYFQLRKKISWMNLQYILQYLNLRNCHTELNKTDYTKLVFINLLAPFVAKFQSHILSTHTCPVWHCWLEVWQFTHKVVCSMHLFWLEQLCSFWRRDSLVGNAEFFFWDVAHTSPLQKKQVFRKTRI